MPNEITMKAFFASFKDVATEYPNFGFKSHLSSLNWWEKVVETSLLQGGADQEGLALSLSLWT